MFTWSNTYWIRSSLCIKPADVGKCVKKLPSTFERHFSNLQINFISVRLNVEAICMFKYMLIFFKQDFRENRGIQNSGSNYRVKKAVERVYNSKLDTF